MNRNQQRLVLLRHGLSTANHELIVSPCGLYYSHCGSDLAVPLHDRGVSESADAGEFIASLFPPSRALPRIYHSQYVRTGQTVDQVEPKLGYPVERLVDARLNKRNYGKFWNLTYQGVETLYPEEWTRFREEGDLDYRPPGGGENYGDVFGRVADFIDEVVNSCAQDILVVSHSIVILAFRRVLEGLPAEEVLRQYEAMQLPNGQALVYCREHRDAPWHLCAMGPRTVSFHHCGLLPVCRCSQEGAAGREPLSHYQEAKMVVSEQSLKTKAAASALATRQAARRVAAATGSVMGELMRLAAKLQAEGQEVINLGPGVPDYPAPDFLKAAAVEAINGNNSYGDSRGLKDLREATALRYAASHGTRFDPDSEVTITAGASAALTAALFAFVNPQDRVIVFEPFFESYVAQIALCGGVPRFVSLKEPGNKWSEKDLARAFTKRTKAVLLNTPHNPTGRVLSYEELDMLAFYCRKNDVLVFADEAYEPFTYGHPHFSIAGLPGMKERTVTLGSISKVFNVSGWRIGHILAPAPLTAVIRRVNDLSLGAPVPLQAACLPALARYDSFVQEVVAQHRLLADRLVSALSAAGFAVAAPEGTFSFFADAGPLGFRTAEEASRFLLEELGILAVPGTSFYRPGTVTTNLRFCFARKAETIEKAAALLSGLSRK